MGFNNSASTITIIAKLTESGRRRILSETSAILSHFITGDSDANYQTNQTLSTGSVPVTGGDKDETGVNNNNIAAGVEVKSRVYVSTTNSYLKAVEGNSFEIMKETISLGESSATTTNLIYSIIDRTVNSETSNYFRTFSLPITSTQKSFFNITSENNGWLDTAFSGFNTDKVLMGSINKDLYGELIDGKSIKISLPVYTATTVSGVSTGLTTYDIYSSFINTSQFGVAQQDVRYSDGFARAKKLFNRAGNTSANIGDFGGESNIAFLVSDNIQKPGNNPTKSWSTGFDTFKPFTRGKSLINFKNNNETSIVADNIIGIAYLDKGLFAITDPTIVSGVATDLYNSSGNTIGSLITNVTTPSNFWYFTGDTYYAEVDSIINNYTQTLTCILDRGEFYRSENKTFDSKDSIRISEIGITDITGELLAVGKFDRQIEKLQNDMVIIEVKIVV